jgi:hypothetical protein
MTTEDTKKPHLVLNWTFDIPNNRLYIDIADDLTYEALQGGTLGYTKIYKGEKFHIDPTQWQETEKFWISENYGEIYGYFQPDHSRVKPHPFWGWPQVCANGLGPDNEYIDHMQRMQILLEGNDMSSIHTNNVTGDLYVTPDSGKTIYKRAGTTDVEYPPEINIPGSVWPDWSQACLMQPRTKGVQLSSYDELRAAGASEDTITLCMNKQWEAPKHPELQQFYVYPTV